MATVSRSLAETEKTAQEFISSLKPQDAATVIGLSGDLGSGKTTFTQAAARILGVTETVTSPTFVIEKIYKLTGQNFDHLIHIDAYRLEKGEELINLGWKEIIGNPKNLILLEWPEKVQNILPKDIRMLQFKFIDEMTREITIG